MPQVEENLQALRKIIASYESVMVAFSGGCDSALVAKVARDVLGPARMKALTAQSESLPEQETQAVHDFCSRYEIPHAWIQTREIENPDYAANPVNRCYFCKNELYRELTALARQENFYVIANGTNKDDLGDWRPGLEAAKEYGVKSPLLEAGLGKDDVREISHGLGLITWDKPAAACLSSRLPYGEAVTNEKLRQIDRGEQVLKNYGFKIVRLRYFGAKAKIELAPEELAQIFSDHGLRAQIDSQIKSLGFKTVEWDPEGYRQGKLNSTRGSANS